MNSTLHKLTKKSLFVFSYNIVGGVVGYITMFFAIKLVGQTSWGVLGSALAFSGILGIITNLGTEATHIKKLTQRTNVEECMGAIFLLKCFLGALFFLISLVVFNLASFFGFSFESPYLEKAVYIALLGIFIGSFANIFKATYQAKLSARRAVVPMFVQLLIQNILIILFSLWYYFNPYLDVQAVGILFTYAYLLGQFGKLVVYSLWAIKDKIDFKKPSLKLLREYALFSVPLALSGIVATIQAYTDRAMLQFFWNTKEVGGYFAVQKIALFITYFGASVSFFLYPTQSHYFERQKKSTFHKITTKSEKYLSLISAPFVFFTFVMADEILNIFRRSLITYSIPLMILMVYAYFNVINRPYGSQITSANMPHEVMRVGVIQAFLNVILNAIFIPKSILGIPLLGLKSTGAALATFLSFLAGFFYFRYRLSKLLKPRYYYGVFWHLYAALVSTMVIFILKLFTPPHLWYPWYSVLCSFLLFSGIYLLILYLLGEIGKEEWKLVISIIKG